MHYCLVKVHLLSSSILSNNLQILQINLQPPSPITLLHKLVASTNSSHHFDVNHRFFANASSYLPNLNIPWIRPNHYACYAPTLIDSHGAHTKHIHTTSIKFKRAQCFIIACSIRKRHKLKDMSMCLTNVGSF